LGANFLGLGAINYDGELLESAGDEE